MLLSFGVDYGFLSLTSQSKGCPSRRQNQSFLVSLAIWLSYEALAIRPFLFIRCPSNVRLMPPKAGVLGDAQVTEDFGLAGKS